MSDSKSDVTKEKDIPRTVSLVVYNDDNGKVASASGEIISFNDKLIQIRTYYNVLFVPIGRLLKVKMSLSDAEKKFHSFVDESKKENFVDGKG